MNKLKRMIAVLIAACMVLTLLPVQFALATDKGNLADYIKGEVATISQVPTSYKGQIWELSEVTPADIAAIDTTNTGEFNPTHKIKFYLRNTDAGMFGSSITFDPAVVDLISTKATEDFYPYTKADYGEDGKFFFAPGIVSAGMTSRSGYVGQPNNAEGFIFTDSVAKIAPNPDNTSLLQFDKTVDVTQEAMGLNMSRWTKDESGARAYKDTDGAMRYNTPTDENVELYTMYFQLKTGQKLSDKTFGVGYDDTQFYNAAAGWTNQGEYIDEGVYLVGFPAEETPDQTVNFLGVTETDGTTPINGATIKIYDNAEMSGDPVKTLTTNGEGKASTTLAALKTYYFSVEKSEYQTSAYPTVAANTITVQKSEVDVPVVKLTKTSALTYPVTIKVLDGDDETTPVANASVLVDDVNVGTTNSAGEVTAQLRAGSHKLNAEASGAYTKLTTAKDITVTAGSTNTASVSIPPVRQSITLPTLKDNNGEVVEGAKIVITKKSDNPTIAWGSSLTANPGDTVEVPKDSAFTITVTAPNYASSPIYLKIENEVVSYYSSPEMDASSKLDDFQVQITKLDDPLYKVTVKQETDPAVYTATVTLTNVEGESGAFGLRYDKKLFSKTNFTLESTNEIQLFTPDAAATEAQNLQPETESGANDQIGYHVFTWEAKPSTETDTLPSFNTLGNEKKVATYTFRLNLGMSADDITNDSITVMPFDKTAAGATIIDYWTQGGDSYTDAYEYFLNRYWRYTDADNQGDKENLPVGRLPEDKATLNGFYQVFASNIDPDANPTQSVDVQTVVEGLEAKKASLTFVVTDLDNAPLKDAEIKLLDSSDNPVGTLTTDLTGMAAMTVDTTLADVTYKYVVSCKGYWDVPETGTKSVTVERNPSNPTAKTEYVEMEQKIYHTPELKYTDDSAVPPEDASLSGDAFAYNNRIYHFNVKAAPGKKFTPPANLTVEIDGNAYSVAYKPAMNIYELDAAKVTGAPTGAADNNGFPSGPIIVKIPKDSISVDNTTYTVNAMAGAHGTVAYDPETTGTNASTTTTTAIAINDLAANTDTGTFTFTADTANGYYVEKVFVNGVQIHAYDNQESFTYSFGKVTMDNTIVVTFWDKVNPSTDTILTLVVGDHGTVDTSTPETVTGIGNTSKVFLNPSADLAFEAKPDTDYLVAGVDMEVNGGGKTPVNADNTPNYTVTKPNAGESVTVYVTFRHKDAQETSTVFVTSYVESGNGTINPVGILIYNKFDSPVFDLTPASSEWQIGGVKIDNTNEIAWTTSPYTLASVTQDTSIGAIFVEKAYKVIGALDYSQGKSWANGPVKTAASVVFTREDGPSAGQQVVATDVTLVRDNASFSAELAPGKWTLTVKKAGYLDYIITGFEMVKAEKDIYFGAADGVETAKKIVLTVGDVTGKGKACSLTDAGTIANAMRTGSLAKIQKRADIDDDGAFGVNDMAYVKLNYGNRYTKQAYADFKD